MRAVTLSQVLEAKKRPSKPKQPDPPTKKAAHTAQAAAQKQAEKNAKERAKEHAKEQEKAKKQVARKQKQAVARKQREVKKDVRDSHARRRKTQSMRDAERAKRQGPDKEGTRGPTPFEQNKAKVDKIPAQLAHCMLAIRFKRKKSTRAAWNICRWSLTRNGYMKPPYSENGKIRNVKQTQKGARRSMSHAMEKGPLNGGVKGTAANKYMKFQRMFKAISKTV